MDAAGIQEGEEIGEWVRGSRACALTDTFHLQSGILEFHLQDERLSRRRSTSIATSLQIYCSDSLASIQSNEWCWHLTRENHVPKSQLKSLENKPPKNKKGEIKQNTSVNKPSEGPEILSIEHTTSLRLLAWNKIVPASQGSAGSCLDQFFIYTQ